MSYQFLFYGALQFMEQHQNLKKSSGFCFVMYNHYRRLYLQYRTSWDLVRTATAWKRMKEYAAKYEDAKLTELLTDLNKRSHVRITVTDNGHG